MKWPRWALVLLVTVVLISGNARAKRVDMELWLSDFNANTTVWINEQFLPSFHAANPDINMSVSFVTWGTFDQKLRTSFAAGSAPDVFQGGSTFRGQAGAVGMGMNIDRYTSKWPDKKDFFPGSWEAVVWDGHDYGIPSLTAPRTIIYRSDLLAEGGFNPDVNPTEWDDVMRASLRLSKVDGEGKAVRWGLNLPSANLDFWMSLMLQNGGQLVSPDGSQPLFNTAEAAEAAQWYHDFYKAQAAFGGSVPPGGFPAGAFAMEWANGKKVADTILVNPDLKGDMRVGYPMKRKLQVAPAYTDSLFMSSQTRNPDQAWELLRFFAQADNLLGYNETLGYFPPRRASMRSSFLEAHPHMRDTFEKVMPYAVGRPTAASWAGLTAAIRAVFTGNTTPEAALQNAASAWVPFKK